MYGGRPGVVGTTFRGTEVEVGGFALTMDVGFDVAGAVVVLDEVLDEIVEVGGVEGVMGVGAVAATGWGFGAVFEDGGSFEEGRAAGGELEEPGLVCGYGGGECVELALVGCEGEGVFSGVPREADDVLVGVLCDYGLGLCFPDEKSAVCAGTGKERSIGRPGEVGDVGIVAREGALRGEGCAVDHGEVVGCSRSEESAAVGMPGDFGGDLGGAIEGLNDTVQALEEGWVLGAQRVDVDCTVGARDGEVVPGRVEGDVLSGVGLAQGHDLVVVFDVDDFDGGFVAGDGHPGTIGG